MARMRREEKKKDEELFIYIRAVFKVWSECEVIYILILPYIPYPTKTLTPPPQNSIFPKRQKLYPKPPFPSLMVHLSLMPLIQSLLDNLLNPIHHALSNSNIPPGPNTALFEPLPNHSFDTRHDLPSPLKRNGFNLRL